MWDRTWRNRLQAGSTVSTQERLVLRFAKGSLVRPRAGALQRSSNWMGNEIGKRSMTVSGTLTSPRSGPKPEVRVNAR